MRGDLVSRPIGDVLQEAKTLFEGGREGAAGHQPGHAAPTASTSSTAPASGTAGRCKTRMTRAGASALGELAEPYGAWVRLHYVYPYPHVDEVIPLMADGPRPALPRRAVPARASRRAEAHEAAGQRREEPRAHRSAGARSCPELVVRSTFIAGFPGETEAEFEHLLDFLREAQIDRAGCFAYSPVEGATANELPGMLPAGSARRAPRALHGGGRRRSRPRKLQRARRRDDAGAGRFGAGARPQGRRRPLATPMRRRSTAACSCCRRRRLASTLKVGEFIARAHRRRRRATTWSARRV